MFDEIFQAKSWRQPGAKQKAPQKSICKAFIIRWAQLGSNLDPLLKNAPGEHFKRGFDCGGGSRPGGSTKALSIQQKNREHY